MKTDDLAGQLRPDLELNAFAKIAISPGDAQKQQSRVVNARTRDIIFGEEFFFDNITEPDIRKKTVHIQLCHQSGTKLKKDVIIGVLEVKLADYAEQLLSKKELHLAADLRHKMNSKKLGKLQISTCLEKKERRLTITLMKADGLPKFGISGPPDPCVRIEFEQNGRRQVKQSRVLKNCCTAVYKEAVMFLVQSTKPVDLQTNTAVTIAVVDTSRTVAGDDIIGVVYLGRLAVDKSETEQWKNTIESSGKEYKATHSLKQPRDTAAADGAVDASNAVGASLFSDEDDDDNPDF